MCMGAFQLTRAAYVFESGVQDISGTVPECLHALTQLEVLAAASNYLKGNLQRSLETVTSLKTGVALPGISRLNCWSLAVMLSSNRLWCNAPDLNLATKLGRGKFAGIVYPGFHSKSSHLTLLPMQRIRDCPVGCSQELKFLKLCYERS